MTISPSTVSSPGVVNALSIDVEDYFQVSGFESAVSRNDWDLFPSRVVDNTRRLLRLLRQHDTRATFFILGWVAGKFPELVQEIADAGHEIGSHGYWHRLIYQQSPQEFREDLRQSIKVLSDITGRPVTSFRAPSFSITRRSMWALDILVDEGIEFDSSIFPIRHDRYGIPDAPRQIHSRQTAAGPILEFPMSVAQVSGINIPASGGGYFRLYPYRLTRRLISQINQSGRPVMFYTHPWELDPGQPRVPGVRFQSRLRHGINLARAEPRLKQLLKDFRFGTMGDVLRTHCSQPDAESICDSVQTDAPARL